MRQVSQNASQISFKQSEYKNNRPQSGRLLSAHYIKNFVQLARNEQNIVLLERYKPVVEPLYKNYLPGARHFGSLCDKNFTENTKIHQLQKFGRVFTQSQSQGNLIQRRRLAPIRVSTEYQQDKSKKISYRLLDESILEAPKDRTVSQNLPGILQEPLKDRAVSYNQNCQKLQISKDGFSTNTKNVDEKQLAANGKLLITKDRFSTDINNVDEKQLTANGLLIDSRTNYKKIVKILDQNHLILFKTLQIQYIDPKKLSKTIKSNHKVFVPFTFLKQILQLSNITEFLEQNLSMQNNVIHVNYKNLHTIDKNENIDTFFEEDEIYLNIGESQFQIIYPQLQLYKQESSDHKSIRLTYHQMITLLDSNFEELKLYNDQFTLYAMELSGTDDLVHRIKFNHSKENFNGNQKIIQISHKFNDIYKTIKFRPPWFEVHEYSELLFSKYFSMNEFKKFISHIIHHSVDHYMKNQLIIKKLDELHPRSKKPRISMDAMFHDGQMELPSPDQIVFYCQQKDFLSEHHDTFDGFNVIYKPPRLEIYDAVTCHTDTRILDFQQLEELLSFNLEFHLSILEL